MICPGNPLGRMKVCGFADDRLGIRDGRRPMEGTLIPAIPVQPLSWADALPLLRNLAVNEAPKEFQGALDITYHIGPGPAVVRVHTQHNYTNPTLVNVFGEIRGSERPEEVILIGNHRDAWVFGAVDPSSGTAALLEVVRGLAHLISQGWTPRRTLRFASWDGEEYSYLGSVNHAEGNSETIREQVVAYLNLDSAASGPQFSASASPGLVQLMHWAADFVIDPETGKPLSEVWDGRVGVLGAGSDYVPFVHHLGVPSLDFIFDQSKPIHYAVYHSNFDSFYWMDTFGDPGFKYHRAAAQYLGTMLLGLSERPLLRMNPRHTADMLDLSLQDARIRLERAGLQDKVALAALESVMQTFRLRADAVHDQMERLLERHGANLTIDQADDINSRLRAVEPAFLSDRGLPGRPWFRNLLQAPGIFQGYGSERFPGLMEAIRVGDIKQIQGQVDEITQAVKRAADRMMHKRSNDKVSSIAVVVALVTMVVLGLLGCAIWVYIRRQRQQMAHQGSDYYALGY